MGSKRCVVMLTLGLVLAAAPVAAQVRTYHLSWWTLRACGDAEPSFAGGHGFAVASPTSGGGWTLRFSGPDGDGVAQNGSTVVGRMPTACGAVEGPFAFEWLPSRSDEQGGVAIDFSAGSGPDSLEVFARGSASRVVASFAAPAEGATVNGSATVRMAVSGPPAGLPLRFRLAVDGKEVAAGTSTTLSAIHTLNTAGLAAGPHQLALTVTDSAGTPLATASRAITVGTGGGNPPSSPPPGGGPGGPSSPTPPASSLRVSLTSPRLNSTVRGAVPANIWVEGAAAGTSTFVLAVDGKTVATQTCACAHVWPSWNTALHPNGAHTVTATVRDSAGRTGSTSITVIVGN